MSLKKEIEKNIDGEFDVKLEIRGCDVDDLDFIEKKEIDEVCLYLAEDNENGLMYIVREDGAGFSHVCLYNSRQDQETLASWNADFDIKLLAEWAGEDEIELCLGIAKENYWVF